jgi:hypothetical protein
MASALLFPELTHFATHAYAAAKAILALTKSAAAYYEVED